VRIRSPGRAPIWVSGRPNGGVAVAQGSSHLLLDDAECDQLVAAIRELRREVQTEEG
jgi:hypothetical protein